MAISPNINTREYEKFKESPSNTVTVRSDKPDQTYLGDLDGGSALVYVGFAAPGSLTSAAVWKIFKLTYSGGIWTSKKYADGNNNYDNVWDNRATLTYS